MSFRALVVPEDPTEDAYILKPLVEALLAEAGKPRAKVEVLANPRNQGYDNAKKQLVERVIDQYSDRDVMLFLPDSDLRDLDAELNNLEQVAQDRGVTLLCCAAVPEVEIWLLAGHVSRISIAWSEARAHPTLRESVFEPFLSSHGSPRRPGGGRDLLMKETLRNTRALLSRCGELEVLLGRLQAVVRRS